MQISYRRGVRRGAKIWQSLLILQKQLPHATRIQLVLNTMAHFLLFTRFLQNL